MDITLYNWYKFHKGEFEEDITEYKGYRIEIFYSHEDDLFNVDAYDLVAQEYVFSPVISIKHITMDEVIKMTIDRIDKKIALNNRNQDILIYE